MSSYYGNRLRVLVAAGIACAIFLSVGRWADIPREPGFEASLSVMPGAAGRMTVVLLIVVVTAVVSRLLTGGARPEATLFATAVGLCALGVRGGPMHYVWMREQLTALPYRQAVELAVYGFALAAVWSGLPGRTVPAPRSPAPGPAAKPNASTPAAILAFLINAAATGALAGLFLASDDEKQVVVGVALAACVGGALASAFSPRPAGTWLWAAPIVVGIIGYVAFALRGAGDPDRSRCRCAHSRAGGRSPGRHDPARREPSAAWRGIR